MILTCPACDTKYVVKDGAIPPGGRKVRCASCKHSWHQDPDPVEAVVVDERAEGLPNPLADISGPPEPDPTIPDPVGEPGPHEVADQFVAEVPEPETVAAAGIDAVSVDMGTSEPVDGAWESAATEAEDFSSGDEAIAAVAVSDPVDAAAITAPDADDQVGYIEYQSPEDRKRSSFLPWLVGALLLIAAAAAFWFFAPAEWKNRAGIAQSTASPLQLVITSKPDRQLLSSGNELVSVSGKVTNPTDKDQDVPPIQATLRNSGSKKIIHSWTIAPPAKVLAPGASASFNSAEVNIPSGGDELTIAWTS